MLGGSDQGKKKVARKNEGASNRKKGTTLMAKGKEKV